MKKFKTAKRFSLDFLGKEWKDAYINFERISIADSYNVLPKFEKASVGTKEITEFLKGKFVDGKGIVDPDGLVDLEAGDLDGLPLEVLSRALSFLSQGVTPDSPKP